MKLFLYIIISSVATISFSQHGVTYPGDLQIDPNDYRIQNLQIRRIVQYETSEILADTSRTRKHFSISYVLDYDSLYRVSSFKYDFEKNERRDLVGSNNQISIYTKIDSTRLFKFTYEGIEYTYNYFENKFIYGFGGLVQIEIFNPNIYRGVIDGVYVQERTFSNQRIVNTTDSEGKLIRTELYYDETLLFTKTFEYRTISNGRFSYSLLSKITKSYGASLFETYIDYQFQ